MGRPTKTIENKESENVVKKNYPVLRLNASNKRQYKIKSKSFLGSWSKGYGSDERNLVRRFKRRLERKKCVKKEAYEEPRPLAEDPIMTFSTNKDKSEKPNLDSSITTSPELSLARLVNSSLSIDSTSFPSAKKKNRTNYKHLKRIELDYQAIQEERKQKYEEIKASRVSHEEKIAKNIEKRQKVTKKITQRTKRGQPIMANQLQYILGKIKNS